MIRVCRLVAIVVLISQMAMRANSGPDTPTTRSEGYALPFGPGPYLPSQAQASFEGFLAPVDFPPASYCGKCHEDIHAQWRQSAHSNSFRAPFYMKNVQLLIDGKGIEYTRHCEGCHNPIALFTGALSRGRVVDRSFDEDGITCSVCHAIEKIQDASGTGSYVMGRPAVMVDSAGEPMAGLPSYDAILAHPERHRQAVMRPFYRTAEFCAVCHKAAVPKSLNGYRWLRMFAVYDEWQNSSWAKESPLPFYKKDSASNCQSCHMPREPAAHDYTQTPGKAASHRWLGANTAIPAVYDYQEQLDRTVQFLKTALRVDLFAIERYQPKEELIAPLNGGAEIHPGETITVDVLVQNSGIGHNLVPEQRDFYECWVEFTARDASGRTIFYSGGLDEKGFLDPTAHTYSNRLLSGSGKLLDLHQVWQTKLRGYDNSIPSGRSDLVRYKFRIPPEVKSPLTVSVQVNYRRFRRGFTNFVFPDQREFPVVNMVAGSMALYTGKQQPQETKNQPPDWQRWNNYGIALLSQQQYAAAQEAFKKVIAMNSGYFDAYINLALAEYSTLIENKKDSPDGMGNLAVGNRDARKFDPALQLLTKALAANPNDCRALFYAGLVLRQQGRLAEAEEKQKLVVQLFPRSRQAVQELGFVYYLQGKYDAARRQFEALQSINPDDLTAHYYLGLIYAKLGMAEEARRESVSYAEHREDPTVGSIAQEFWRSNPSLVNELAPYHVHQDTFGTPKSKTVGGYLP